MNAPTSPVISIIMPVFNSGRYLTEAIDSVLSQVSNTNSAQLPQFELLIVDDRSNDAETLKILRQATSRDPRIRVLSNSRSKGAAGARNTGISSSRGEWIAFIDSDDIWLPDSLALRWGVVQKFQNACWVASRFLILRPVGSIANTPDFLSAEDLLKNHSRSGEFPEVLVKERPTYEFSVECFTGIMTVLLRKKVLVEKGGFDESLWRAEDYKLWFMCSFDQTLYFLNTETSYYRIHPQSLTHGQQPRLLYEDKMIDRLLEEPQAQQHRQVLLRRLDVALQENCYFYRSNKVFGTAFATAAKWVRKRPHRIAAWKELLAASLRVS